jgi:outer membrane protein OmpA-like peptidoglycan-associated protein
MGRFAIMALGCAVMVAAQRPPLQDKKGCAESTVLSKMPGCVVQICDVRQYHTALMPLNKQDRTNNIEGAYERLRYLCPPETGPLEKIRNAEGALKAAGYNILYSDKYFTTRYWLTARKGPQWVYVYTDGAAYEVTSVLAKQMEQQMQANAAGWADAINQTGRVSIYGINFDTGKATIRPDSEPALKEVVQLLQNNAGWAMVVAGHTDNVGARELNWTLSRQRAESVIAWLALKGIDRTRLIPAGFGDTRPLVDNGTEDGRAKNRRVDLVKLY